MRGYTIWLSAGALVGLSCTAPRVQAQPSYVVIELAGRHAVRIGQLALTTDGVSYVDLVNSDPIGTAGIDLSGTSYVTLNLDQGATVSGTLAGVSSLLYYGSDVTISLSNTPTTSVVHIGDTKY